MINDSELERSVASKLFYDEDFYYEALASELVRPELFKGAVGDLVRIQGEIFEKNGVWPTPRVVEGELLLRKAQGNKQAEILIDVLREQISDSTADVDVASLVEFLTRRRVESAVYEAMRSISTSDWSLDDVAGKLMEAGQQTFILPSSMMMDHSHLDEEETSSRHCITVGIPEVDEYLGGGIARGELACFVAPTGVGKTHMGCQMLARAAEECEKGELVIYVTCEVSKYTIAQRVDSVWSGVAINDIFKNKERVREVIQSKIKQPPMIVEYASGDATIAGIASIVKLKKAQGFDVRLVVIDYDEEMKQEGKADSLRHSLGKIYRGGRKMASDFQTAVCIISQTNSAGARAKIVREMDVAESFTKSKAADIMLTLSSEYWLYIAKNRGGGQSHIAFPCTVNTSYSDVRVTGPAMSLFDALEQTSDETDELRRVAVMSSLDSETLPHWK